MKKFFLHLLIFFFTFTTSSLFAQEDETELAELVISKTNSVKDDLLNIVKKSENTISHQDQQLEFQYLLSQNNNPLESIDAVLKFKKLGGRIYDPNIKWSKRIYKNDKYEQFSSSSLFYSLIIDCTIIKSDFNTKLKRFIENGVVEKKENTYTVYHPNNTSISTIIKTDSIHQLLIEIESFGLPITHHKIFYNEQAYFKTTYSFNEGKYLIENITAKCKTNDKLNILFDAKKNTLSRNYFSKKKTMLEFIIFYNNKQNDFFYGLSNEE